MFKIDTYRLIRKTFKRFFSLIMIVLIGVAFMMGLFSTSTIMRESVDVYADKDRLHDVQLYSPFGFCEEDIEFLKESEGIEDVFGSKFKDVYCRKPDGEVIVARFEEMDRNIDQIELTAGRMPRYDDEVPILVDLDSQKAYNFDDHLEIYLEDEKLRDYFPYERYKIVGFAASPAYMAKTLGTSTLNNEELGLVVFCKNRLFKADYYTTLYLTLKGSKDRLSFSDDYRKFIDEHLVDVENAAAEQQNFHRDNIVN
ncbi:MAG: ABC transporter permease, partial [Erysipelotrichaceae bacterium]|nr:ABC transporter permease [Erysipelotrichaceae bacterium]